MRPSIVGSWTVRCVGTAGCRRSRGAVTASSPIAAWDTPNAELLKFLRKATCPVVETQGTRLVPHAGRVMISNEQVGRVGAEHLLSLNYKHLAFVTFEENAMEVPAPPRVPTHRRSRRRTLPRPGF